MNKYLRQIDFGSYGDDPFVNEIFTTETRWLFSALDDNLKTKVSSKCGKMNIRCCTPERFLNWLPDAAPDYVMSGVVLESGIGITGFIFDIKKYSQAATRAEKLDILYSILQLAIKNFDPEAETDIEALQSVIDSVWNEQGEYIVETKKRFLNPSKTKRVRIRYVHDFDGVHVYGLVSDKPKGKETPIFTMTRPHGSRIDKAKIELDFLDDNNFTYRTVQRSFKRIHVTLP
ncbi:hypothetical protein ISG33_11220 [Glaciecola sp. MH2013]|uniref:hypothetical protein n=1 Tax=Glaciecola sp. MH2013 TaxID=2785524 RepID=UPI0018A100E4|nr:hypothetical protein [Glaciecola sp. MH2013]MBF7073970.1 hypothetical protein [Glaciecola sp. MH2013]